MRVVSLIQSNGLNFGITITTCSDFLSSERRGCLFFRVEGAGKKSGGLF